MELLTIYEWSKRDSPYLKIETLHLLGIMLRQVSNIFRGWNSRTGLSNPCHCSPQNEVSFSPYSGGTLCLFVLIVSYRISEHHWKESGPILLTPPLRYFYTLLKSLSAFSSPVFLLKKSAPVIFMALHWTPCRNSMTLLNCRAQNWTQCSRRYRWSKGWSTSRTNKGWGNGACLA